MSAEDDEDTSEELDLSASTPPPLLTHAPKAVQDDLLSPFSNVGRCVDIFAPGSFIVSSSNAGLGAEEVMSGTSMAAPHVAGVAALVLEQVCEWEGCWLGWVRWVGGRGWFMSVIVVWRAFVGLPYCPPSFPPMTRPQHSCLLLFPMHLRLAVPLGHCTAGSIRPLYRRLSHRLRGQQPSQAAPKPGRTPGHGLCSVWRRKQNGAGAAGKGGGCAGASTGPDRGRDGQAGIRL
jgi:hypothetical protein